MNGWFIDCLLLRLVVAYLKCFSTWISNAPLTTTPVVQYWVLFVQWKEWSYKFTMFYLIHTRVNSRETFLNCVMWTCINYFGSTHPFTSMMCFWNVWKHFKNTLIRGLREISQAYCVNVPLLDVTVSGSK